MGGTRRGNAFGMRGEGERQFGRVARKGSRGAKNQGYRCRRYASGDSADYLSGDAAGRSRASSLRAFAARFIPAAGGFGAGFEGSRGKAVEEATHPVCSLEGSQEHESRPRVVLFA